MKRTILPCHFILSLKKYCQLTSNILNLYPNANITQSPNWGNFPHDYCCVTLLDFNVEKQFLNADVLKLEEIAKITSGKSVFYQDTDTLIQHLLNDNKYQTIQKSTKKIVPLVDFKILLFLIALSLAIEWFLRKYNGLI